MPARWRRRGGASSISRSVSPTSTRPRTSAPPPRRRSTTGWTHYGPFFGLPALREAIAADATTRKGFPVDADSVVVVPGAKPIMFYAMLALVEPGDEVVYPDPGSPSTSRWRAMRAARTEPYAIRQANDFRVDLDELASLLTPRTKLLVLNSPANPTGGVLTRSDMDRVAELVAAHPDLAVLTDEIYGRIVHDGEAVSLGSLPGMADRTIIARRLLQDLRDDRLAPGLRDRAAVPPRGVQAA